MYFSKDFLQEMVDEGIERKIIDHDRWSVTYEEIFEFEEKYYKTYYSVGATELQYIYPYEDETNMIKCDEVQQVEKLVKVWECVNNN